MGISETLIIYLVIGLVVAVAIAMSQPNAPRWSVRRGLETLFWPFFAPGLLGRPRSPAPLSPQPVLPAPVSRLRAAQARLMGAVNSLSAFGEGTVQPQLIQIDTMMKSLDKAECRLTEMDELLKTREFDVGQVDVALTEIRGRGFDEREPRVRSLLARRENIERLRKMRARTGDELERALLKIEEISSKVVLLRFADHAETRLADLMADVSGSVETLTTVVLEMSEI